MDSFGASTTAIGDVVHAATALVDAAGIWICGTCELVDSTVAAIWADNPSDCKFQSS